MVCVSLHTVEGAPVTFQWHCRTTVSGHLPSDELEDLKTLVVSYKQRTAQKNEPASYSRLKEMDRSYVEQKIRANNFNARNEDGSFQGQQPGKETREEILKAWKENAQTPKNQEMGLHGLRKACVREESRAAASKISTTKAKGQGPVLRPKREDTRLETEK